MSKPADIPPPQEPPRNPTIAEQKAQRAADKAAKLKQMEEDRRTQLEGFRSSEPPEEEEPPEKEEEPPIKEEEEDPPIKEEEPRKKEEEEEEPPEKEDDDEDDFDFDFDDEEEPTEKGEEPPIKEEEEGEGDVTGIRQRLKEEGQARKSAEADLVEAQTEVENLQKKVTELESSKQNLQAANVNWNTHEKIVPLWEKFDKKIQRGATGLPDEATASDFLKSHESLVSDYFKITEEAKTPQEQVSADIQFKKQLVERFTAADGTEPDGTPLVDAIKSALDIYQDIEDTKDDLVEKFKEGSLSTGMEAYDAELGRYSDVLNDLGNIDPDIIEADPMSPHAVVGAMINDSPEEKKRSAKEAKRIQEFVFGLRPLDQKDMDIARRRAAARNMPLEEYLQFRESNFVKKRSAFLNDIHTMRMVMTKFPDMQKVYSKFMEKKQGRKAVRDSLKKAGEPKKQPEKKEPPVKASEREYIPPSRRFK